MPTIEESKFVRVNEQYGDGIAVDTYNGEISLVAAKQNSDTGEIWMEWTFPAKRSDGKSVPGEKMLPWKIRLGSREQALTTLVKLAGILGVKLVVDKNADPPPPQGTPQPQEFGDDERKAFGTSPSGGDQDDIVF